MADLVAEFYSNAIPRWVSGDLADLGCGKAPLLGAYRHLCSSILLADWSNSLHPNPLLDVNVDLNEPLPLPSESFDVVLLSDVLEHIPEPRRLLGEVARILRPGGRLLLNVPFAYGIHEAPHDYYRYTRYALERLVGESGLDIVELSELGGWVEVVSNLWCKLMTRARLPILAVITHRAVIAFHRTTFGKMIAAKTGSVIPLGYGMIAIKNL